MVLAHSAAASLQHHLQDSTQQQKKTSEDIRRTPLALSDKNNGAGVARPTTARPRNREVSSRYKNTTPSAATSSSSFSSSVSVHPPRRCPSPNVARTQASPDLSKRSLSAERRRASPCRQNSDTPKLANGTQDSMSRRPVSRGGESLWPSTRNLSASMQREPSGSNPKPANGSADHTLKSAANIVPKPPDSTQASQRKLTPERKRTPRRQNSTESENARPVDNSHLKPDQQRWPGKRLIGSSLTRTVDLTRSVDFSDRPSRMASILSQGQSAFGARAFAGSKAFQRSINEPANATARRASLDGSRPRTPTRRLSNLNSDDSVDSNPVKPNTLHESCKQVAQQPQENSVPDALGSPSDLVSDGESVSSGSNSATQEANSRVNRRSSSNSRATSVSGRFTQEPNSRLNRLPGPKPSTSDFADPSSASLMKPFSASTRLKAVSSSTNVPLTNGAERLLASPRLASRLTGLQHSVSPVKIPVSPSPTRGMQSPTRTRTMLTAGNSLLTKSQTASSVISFGVDVRKGRKSITQVEEAHHLRIFHNRLLQWRFVNAKAEAAIHAQKVTAEKLLYNVWMFTSELRESVTMKQIRLQQLKQENKLSSILRSQRSYLEEWACLERDHRSSLSGAIEALESATLRLPVTGGARADIQAVKEAVSSAVDVMQAMGSAICSLLPKVEGMNRLVSELADVAAYEKSMLGECSKLLATAAAMEVEESSLRAHLIQLKQGRHQDLIKSSDINMIAVQLGQ